MKAIGTIPPFGLRMPEELRQRVKAAADTNRRSMNSEIVIILERVVQEQNTETKKGEVTA